MTSLPDLARPLCGLPRRPGALAGIRFAVLAYPARETALEEPEEGKLTSSHMVGIGRGIGPGTVIGRGIGIGIGPGIGRAQLGIQARTVARVGIDTETGGGGGTVRTPGAGSRFGMPNRANQHGPQS